MNCSGFELHMFLLFLCSEGHDRTDLLLPGHQEDLLKQLKTAGKPMIVVVMSGGPVDISYAKVTYRIVSVYSQPSSHLYLSPCIGPIRFR